MQVTGTGVLGLVLAGEDRPSTVPRCHVGHVVRNLGQAQTHICKAFAGICSIENSHVFTCFLFFHLGRVGVSSLAGTSYGNTVQVHHWDGDSRIRVTVSLLFPHFVAAIRARSACRTDASITHLLHSVAKAGRS